MKRTKSKAIREILAKQPAATAKEVQAALAAKRIKASVGLISKVKSNGKASKKRGHKSKGVTLEGLLAVKGLVARLGSIDEARQSLDALAKLLEA
jgi:hypothetical protein